MVSYTLGDCDERPWGNWQIIDVGLNYVVKRIVVKPRNRLSLQRHKFRSENWIIVAGTARITCGDAKYLSFAGDQVYIPRGAVHRIENDNVATDNDLVFIEVQHGEYLDENDIERFDDDYGRIKISQ